MLLVRPGVYMVPQIHPGVPRFACLSDITSAVLPCSRWLRCEVTRFKQSRSRTHLHSCAIKNTVSHNRLQLRFTVDPLCFRSTTRLFFSPTLLSPIHHHTTHLQAAHTSSHLRRAPQPPSQLYKAKDRVTKPPPPPRRFSTCCLSARALTASRAV